MMNSLIQHILFRMKIEELVNDEDEDVYRFGLECLLLKMIHDLSYIFIGFLLHMTVPMLASVMILMGLKSKTGGYHAKTRLGCYCFSCFIVFLICLLNKVEYPTWLFALAVFSANFIIWRFAPVENANRDLDKLEIKDFRRQALFLLCVVDVAVIATTAIKSFAISQWLLNGLLMESGLVIIGKGKNVIIKQTYCAEILHQPKRPVKKENS